MAKRMKSNTPKKKRSNTLVIKTQLPSMGRIIQRPAFHKSAKAYNRRQGKQVSE